MIKMTSRKLKIFSSVFPHLLPFTTSQDEVATLWTKQCQLYLPYHTQNICNCDLQRNRTRSAGEFFVFPQVSLLSSLPSFPLGKTFSLSKNIISLYYKTVEK